MVYTHDQKSCAGGLLQFTNPKVPFLSILSDGYGHGFATAGCYNNRRPPRDSHCLDATSEIDPLSDDFSQLRQRANKLFGKGSQNDQKRGALAPSPRKPSRRVGLTIRGKTYHLRFVVPRELQATIGRKEFTRSLKTSRLDEAVRKARTVGAEFENWLASAEANPPDVSSVKHQAVTGVSFAKKPKGKTMRELCEVFLSDPTKNRSGKAVSGYWNSVELAEAVVGREKVINAIERQDCRDIIEVLKWVPSNSKKRFPTLEYKQAAEKAKSEGLPLLSPKTVNDYIIKLSALMNFAIDEGYVDRNPFRGLKVADDVHPRDKRNPFTNKQLRQIFNAPLYRGCLNDEEGYDQVGTAHPRRGRFWIPLIALYCGTRLNEACQLDLTDVRAVGGVECLSISTASVLNSKDKKVKTRSSFRLIPIHAKLVEIGFLDYVNAQRRLGSSKLFPELPISTTGYYSDPFSKWFARFLVKCAAARDKTSFHSFRHCFRDAMRNAKLDHEVGLALGGWTSASGKDAEIASIYGNGYGIELLRTAINQIEYPTLDLNHLVLADPPQLHLTG